MKSDSDHCDSDGFWARLWKINASLPARQNRRGERDQQIQKSTMGSD